MSHNCESLVLRCMDWRLWSGLEDWFTSSGMAQGGFDLVSVAGAVKSLTSPSGEAEKEFILKHIKISRDLHHIKRVIIINHTDCGGYGGSQKFSDQQAELEFHRNELNQAVAIISERFPEITIEKYLALLKEQSGKWQVTVEKVS